MIETNTIAHMRMLACGMSTHQVAAGSGLSIHTVRMTLSGGSIHLRTRRRIEAVLGPIWSGSQELEMRNLFIARFGFDPILANLPDIRRAARQIKVRGRAKLRRKQDLIDAIAAALKAVGSANKNETSEKGTAHERAGRGDETDG